jgi:hypothetical protein
MEGTFGKVSCWPEAEFGSIPIIEQHNEEIRTILETIPVTLMPLVN